MRILLIVLLTSFVLLRCVAASRDWLRPPGQLVTDCGEYSWVYSHDEKERLVGGVRNLL